MKAQNHMACDFCKVPLPNEDTPFQVLRKPDAKGQQRVFCCIGCWKGYQRLEKYCEETNSTLDEVLAKPQPVVDADNCKKNPEAIQDLIRCAVDFGASRAIALRARDVVVDIRAQYKCRIPFCRRMGTNLCCPPFSPSVTDIEKIRDQYTTAILIQCCGRSEEFLFDAAQKGLQTVYYMRLNNIVSWIEALAQRQGFYLAMGFGGGHCKLCGHGIDPKIKCNGVIDGRPHYDKCRYPLRARPAVESVGIDIFKTAAKLGIDSSFVGITSQLEEVSCVSTFGLVFLD